MKILNTSRPQALSFAGKSRDAKLEQVKAAAETLKKLLPLASMVQGTLKGGKPEIFIGFRTKDTLESARATLMNTPHVTQDPNDKSLKYREYPLRLFDGVSTL